MPTPTDPYSSSSPRPFEEDILAPIPEGATPTAAVGEAIASGSMTANQKAAMDAARQGEAPQVLTAADFAADPVPAGAQNPKIVGSLSLGESAVRVENAEIPNAFENGAPAAQQAPKVRRPTVARPEATLADGSGYAPELSGASNAESAVEAPVRRSVMDTTASTLAPNSGATMQDAAPAADAESPVPSEQTQDSSWQAGDALPEGPKSRVGAHIGIFFATLLLVPLAWYLLSDSSIRLSMVHGNQWETGKVAIPVLLETIGGLVVTGLLWFLARASSLGAFVWGLLLTVLGAIGVIMPYFARNTIAAWVTDQIAGVNTLTANIADHFALDLGAGRILFFGFILLMTSIVSHYARKRGHLAGIQITRREVALGK